MSDYIGLDVSLEDTHICVVTLDGSVTARAVAATEPASICRAIAKLSATPELVVLETGGQSAWLQQGLKGAGLNAVILDARQAKKALSARLNKTDANDAEGLAQLARTGWYRRVLAKRPATRRLRAVLMAREQLVRQRRDLTNQLRGILRSFGLALGCVTHRNLPERVEVLCESEPALRPVLAPLLRVQAMLCDEISDLGDRLTAIAHSSADAQRLMSVPGVGPLTALAFMTALDEPTRFARSCDVGAYLGLTSRRYQSGQIDWSGRISKQGDALARSLLYEAANVLLTRVKTWTRELAVILHRIWVSGSTFNWAAQPA